MLLQGALQYCCWNVWLFWACVCFDEINQLLPVLDLYELGLELFGGIRLLLLFDTQQITTMKVVFAISGRLLFAIKPVCSPKSVAGHLLPYVPCLLDSPT